MFAHRFYEVDTTLGTGSDFGHQNFLIARSLLGAKRSETGVYALVHEDFAMTKQQRTRLEIRILA